jgi:hypothetical protein
MLLKRKGVRANAVPADPSPVAWLLVHHVVGVPSMREIDRLPGGIVILGPLGVAKTGLHLSEADFLLDTAPQGEYLIYEISGCRPC